MALGERFDEAVAWARALHAGQARKLTGAPYFGHLLATAASVLLAGGDEEEVVAALLHDAVEDQGGAPIREEIERRFGPRVAALVDGCTDADFAPKPPWRPRKEAHLARLAGASSGVRLIKAADALDNVRSLIAELRKPHAFDWSAFRGGRDGTLWYYASTAALLQDDPTSPLANELAVAVSDLQALA